MDYAQKFYNNKRDALIKEFEKFKSKPYLDSELVPTIGFGTTFYPDGTRVSLQDPSITKEKGLEYFNHHLDEFGKHGGIHSMTWRSPA